MLLILLKTFWAHFIFEYTTLGLKNTPDEINPIWSANKSTLAKLGVRRKLPAGHWLYTPNRMQYFRIISAAAKCPDILQDSHWQLVWMISRWNREDKMLYRRSLHIENDLYNLHLLRVIVPQGTQGIRVLLLLLLLLLLLSEDYPLSPTVSLNQKCWFDFIVLFELGDIITISLHLVHPKPFPKSLNQNRYILVRHPCASP